MACVFHVSIPSLDEGVQLSLRVFHAEEPRKDGDAVEYCVNARLPTLVLVHQYGIMGVDESSGSSTIMLGDEVRDVQAVCRFVRANEGGLFGTGGGEEAGRLVLIGDSAGAPVAGSAVGEDGVVAYVGMGYTFGWWAGILFSGHFAAVKAPAIPRLFIQGTTDGFTSPEQLEQAAAECAGDSNEVLLVPGKGHFELENPAYDQWKAETIQGWMLRVVLPQLVPDLLVPAEGVVGEGSDSEGDAAGAQGGSEAVPADAAPEEDGDVEELD